MKKIFTGALCLFAMSVSAQSWTWAVRSGGVNSEMQAKSIVSDASGNTYVAGFFVGTVTIGDHLPVTSTTPFEADGYIAKYNSSGNVSWFHVINGAGIQVATGIALDPSNNICVTGYHSVGATFSAAVSLVTLPNYQNAFVAKYDNAGNALWAETIGDGVPVLPQTNSTVFATGIGTDAMGSMYITGSYCSGIKFGATSKQAVGGSGDYDVFVAKCDNAGTVNWLSSAGGTNIDESNAIAVQPNGIFFITGRFLSSTMTLDAQVLTKTASWQNDMFVASYSAAGIANWAVKSSGLSAGSDMACGNGIATDGRSCYVTGYYTGDMNLGSIALTAPSTGAENIFTAKYSYNGALVWALQEGSVNGSDVAKCIAYDPADGRVYTAGYFRGTTSFNGGAVSVAAIGSADGYYAKYSSSTGAFLELLHGATAANDLVPLSVCKGLAGTHSFYSCGYYGGFTTVFYHTLIPAAGGKVLGGYTAGVDAAFVNKYAFPNANRLAETAGENEFSVYPVPAADHVNIDFTGAQHETVLVTLNDLSGREILREEIPAELGRAQVSLDVSQLPAGIYFVAVNDGEQRQVQKIIVGKE